MEIVIFNRNGTEPLIPTWLTTSPTNHRHANSWKFENQFFLTLTKKLSEWAIKFNRLFWDSGVHRDIVHTSHVIIAYTLYTPPPKKKKTTTKKQKNKKNKQTNKKNKNKQTNKQTPPQKKKKTNKKKTKKNKKQKQNKTEKWCNLIRLSWCRKSISITEMVIYTKKDIYIYMSSCWHHILTISIAVYRKLPGER